MALREGAGHELEVRERPGPTTGRRTHQARPHAAPDFVTEGRAAILLGKPGRGTTHLAIAIACRALQNGFDARFATAAELIDELSVASRAGRMRDALAPYLGPHVLVADEVG
ncbi:MAG: ATP-binding protein [Sorangiineae bacterium]|nr:ATP-binding protein [Sorangiineae bacterium]